MINILKVVHLIPTLGSGGAETMLYKLIKNKSNNIQYKIITLKGKGFYEPLLKEFGIQIVQFSLFNIFEILKILKSADVIQSWMYHADLFNILICKFILKKKIVWGLRRSYLKKENMKITTYFIAKLNSYLSRYVDLIISCTAEGLNQHKQFGYDISTGIVIPNGFELESFKYKAQYNNEHILQFINVARWEPLKDHDNLLQAFHYLKNDGIPFNLKLIGGNIISDNEQLQHLVQKYQLEDYVELLGESREIPEHMYDSDIYVSSSISEGFPNVLGEAMATGLICIATDAGDSARILNNSNLIVPIQNSKLLYQKIKEIISLEGSEIMKLKEALYRTVELNYDIKEIVKNYEKKYLEM